MTISLGGLIGAVLFIVILYGLIRYVIIPLIPGAGSPPWIGVIYFVALVLACLAIAWALGVDIPFISFTR